MFNLVAFIELLRNYGDQAVPTMDFCDEYIRLFAAIEAGEIDDDLFHILEDLFEDIDAYSAMWTLEDERQYPYRITEPTLRVEVEKGLLELEEYRASFGT